MKEGLTGTARLTVSESDCARAMGSGDLDVLATPRMVALMEEAACAAVAGALEPGQTTVGMALEIEHFAATPPGLEVHATAVLERVEGRMLHFRVEAADDREPVGRGHHRRVTIDARRFMDKVARKT